jgi:hypothetical protein
MIFGMVPQNPLKIPFVYKLFTFALLRQLIHHALSGMGIVSHDTGVSPSRHETAGGSA